MSELDLGKIRDRWLGVCAACDAGLAANCTHPEDDYRPVILALVLEVEELRRQRGDFRNSALMYAAMVGQHVSPIPGYTSMRCESGLPGCDDLACVCTCHDRETADAP